MTSSKPDERQVEEGSESLEDKYCADFGVDVFDEHDGWDSDPFKYEDINDYHKGGFHPVHLNDRLDGRYRVAHKLGYGAYGVVWLCYDEAEHIWRAVKILSADQSPEDCPEINILEVFGGFDSEKVLRENHLVLPVGSFTIDGPNGHHTCIVFHLLGPVCNELQSHYAACTELLKDICFQLAQAMDFLHSHHLCHGDFRPNNIMFRLADGVDQWPEEKLLEVYGKPPIGRVLVKETHEEAEASPGLPRYMVGITRSKGFRFDSGVISASIAVGDLGVSFDASSPPSNSKIPVGYATPEAILGMQPPGFTNDAWAMMGTMLVLRTGNKSPENAYWIGPDHVLRFCEFVDGPMPENFRAGWKKIGKECQNDNDPTLPATFEADFYHSSIRRVKEENNGIFDWVSDYLNHQYSTWATQESWDVLAKEEGYKTTGLLPRWTQPKELNRKGIWYALDKEEIAQLGDLCHSVYKWQPEERASSTQILDHPWFGDRNKTSQSGFTKTDLAESIAAPAFPETGPEIETVGSSDTEQHILEALENVPEASYYPQTTKHTTSDVSKLVEQPELVSELVAGPEPKVSRGTSNSVLSQVKRWWLRYVTRSQRTQRKR